MEDIYKWPCVFKTKFYKFPVASQKQQIEERIQIPLGIHVGNKSVGTYHVVLRESEFHTLRCDLDGQLFLLITLSLAKNYYRDELYSLNVVW